MRCLVIALVLMAQSVWAFIPPVTSFVRDAFEGRRGGSVAESILRHSVTLHSLETVELEEHWVGDANKANVVFKVMGSGATLSGTYERRAYRFASKTVSSESASFVKYLYGTAEEFLSGLLAERFVKREQLAQFKADFNPTGDPAGWDVKENYIVHDGISLGRVKGTPAYRIWNKGDEGSNTSRAVFFEKAGAGLRRLEFRNSTKVEGWTFSEFGKYQSPGLFPRRMSFDSSGKEIVQSELVVMRPGRGVDLKALSRGAPPTQNLEEAVQILLKAR